MDGSIHAIDVVNKISCAIEYAVANTSAGRLLACRIELTGRTEFHDYIFSSGDQLTAEARAAALALGDEAAWIERLVIKTEPLTANTAAGLSRDAVDCLSGIMSEAANDPGLRSQLEAEIGELVRKLPHDIRADVEDGILKAATTSDYPELVSEASRYLTARLAAEGA